MDNTKEMKNKKTEFKEILESREWLSSILEASRDGIVVEDQETILYANKALAHIYGYDDPRELIGKHVSIIQDARDNAQMLEYGKRRLRGADAPTQYEFVGRKKDGSLVDLELSVSIVEKEGKKLIIGIVRSIAERKQLEEARSRLEQAISNSNDVVFMTTPEGEITYVNPAFTSLYGYSAEEVIGKNPRILKSGKNPPELYDALWKTILSGKSIRVEIVNRTKDGRLVDIESTVDPVMNNKRERIGFIAIQREITARKEVEDALLESEARFRTLMHSSSAAIFTYTEKFTYVNPATLDLTGYSEEEMLKMNFWDVVHPNHRDFVRQRGLARLRGEEVPNRYEFAIVRKNGESRWIEFSAGMFKLNGKACAIGTAFDITERRKFEERLQNSERLYKDLVENSNEVTYLLDRHLQLTYVSPVIEQKTGYAPAELLGRQFADIIYQDDVETVKKQFRDALRGGTMQPVEFRFKTKAGQTRWVRASTVPIIVGNRLESIRGVAIDITDQKRAIDALKASEERFRTLTETASSAIIIYQGEYLRYVNNATERMLGYTKEEMLSMKFWEVFHPDDREQVRERDMACQRGEPISPAVEVRVITKTGDVRWVDFTAAMIEFDGKQAVLVTAFDITERKRSEEALRKSEARLRQIFENDLTGDYISTPDGRLLDCNPAFLRIFGFKNKEEALATRAELLHTHPDASARCSSTVCGKQKVLCYEEGKARRLDGTVIHIIENAAGIFNRQGELVEIHGYIFDDSARKKLEEQFYYAQKMESIGTLAGGIAHDFNNILGIILGHAEVLRSIKYDEEKLAKGLEAITKATYRGAALVKQLLTFARKTEPAIESIQINEVIEEIATLVRETFPKKIEFRIDLEKDLPSVNADHTQVHQAILNLAVNARDAMPEGGTLSFSSARVSQDELKGKIEGTLADEYVRVTVQDTGTGMDEETKRRIFEPFFTTKEKGRGTGLGLAVVFGVMKGHNGHILVESTVGVGTVFHLYFPVPHSLLEVKLSASSRSTQIVGGNETILVVEDEETFRNLIAQILEEQGYRVLLATNGPEGFETYAKDHNGIGLVITDLGLPGLSGAALIRRLRSIEEEVLSIAITGYLEPNMRAELRNIGVHEILIKPFEKNELLQKVRSVLDMKR